MLFYCNNPTADYSDWNNNDEEEQENKEKQEEQEKEEKEEKNKGVEDKDSFMCHVSSIISSFYLYRIC